jgi:WD40 repeat protein
MSRIFLSHSSKDKFAAIALRDWLASEGWNDVFLDLDPERGIAAGERWERALHAAANSCEAVIFVVSGNWLASGWCLREYMLARALNKKLFGVLIDPMKTIGSLPDQLKGVWQVVDLAGGQDHRLFRAKMPGSVEEGHVTYSESGLRRLKRGLEKAGLDQRFFIWPPEGDPGRAPYPGLRPLEESDAGIFFGRDAPIIEGMDFLRRLRKAEPPRLLAILGASGAGKSSFLRAGLLPRLARDEGQFIAVPVLRPERAALTGKTGFIEVLSAVLSKRTGAEVRDAVREGTGALLPLLSERVREALKQRVAGDETERPPAVVIAIDQAEELFRAEGREESATLLDLLADLVKSKDVAVIVIFSIRSDSYDALENAKALEGLTQVALPLLPMPRGGYAEVIKGPARRVEEAGGKLKIEPALAERLLADIETGTGDALPLLAFTLEQLYRLYRQSGELLLKNYEDSGALKGAIKEAVKRALDKADGDPRIPREAEKRFALLREGFIPWLAGVDPDSKTVRRNIARRVDIPSESGPLIDLLVDERLLSASMRQMRDSTSGEDISEATIEPTHEALLRQWSLLDGWLKEDFGLLATLEGVKRAARDWDANKHGESWLTHQGQRLAEAQALDARPDIAARLAATDRAYLAGCREREEAARAEADQRQREREEDQVRRLADARKITRRTFVGAAAALAFAAAAGAFGWYALSEKNMADVKTAEATTQKNIAEAASRDAVAQKALAEERLRTAQIAESRFAAQEAVQQLDPELAVQTALQGLPKKDGDRPFDESNWTALVEAEAKRPGLRIIRGAKKAPSSIEWDPPGNRIAATDGEQVAVWDASTGRQLLAVADKGINVAWSSDGSLLASTSGALRSASNGRITAQISKDNRLVRWAPYSQRLLAVARGRARIFRGSDGTEEVTLAISGEVKQVIWKSDATRVLAITTDGIAHICDAASGEEVISWSLEEPGYAAVDWSVDGKIVAAAFDKKVILWNANDATKRAEIPGEYIQRIRFSPDGSWLMVAGYHGVALNDTRDGRQLKFINVQADDAALSPDGRLIGVASSGGVYEWEPQRERRRWLRWNSLAYRTIAWSPDSLKLAASADYSLVIKNKNQRTAPEIDILTATTGWEIAPYTAVAHLDADRSNTAQRVFVSLSQDNRVLNFYDLVTKRLLAGLSHENQMITFWSWNPDGTRLVVVFEDGSIKLWSNTGQFEIEISAAHKDVTSVLWGDEWFITRAKDDSAKVWRTDTGTEILSYVANSLPNAFWSTTLMLINADKKPPIILDTRSGSKISTLKTSDVAIKKVVWSPDDRQLVSISATDLGTLWDVQTGSAIFSWQMSDPDKSLAVSWAPDGKRIATFSEKREGALRDARTGQVLAELTKCWSVNWSSDGRRVLIGCKDGFFLDTSSGKTLTILKGKEGTLGSLGWEATWDPTGSKVLATHSSDIFYIFESESGVLLRTFYIVEPWIRRGIWDGGGNRVTVFSGDRIVSAFGTARVFDINTGQQIAVLRGHEKNILGGRWDPSETKLLTWSQDTTARIWDVGASRELAKLSGHEDFVLSGEWSRDGTRVTTRYWMPPVYTWDVRPFELGLLDRMDWMRASLGISAIGSDIQDRFQEELGGADARAVCERGAENPIDPLRRQTGVQIQEINPYPYEVAPACEKAVSEDPHNGRFNYLYGRTMLHMRELKKAYAALETAVSQGYLIASIDLGEMLLDPADSEHYDPERGVDVLQKAAEVLPIADVTLARYFESADRERARRYLIKAANASESHAYQLLAEQAEQRAQSDSESVEQWIEAFRNWSIAFNLSRYVQKRGSADWEFPLARRAALAWHLAERGRTMDVINAYRNSVAVAPIE